MNARFPDDPGRFAEWQRRYRDHLAGWLMARILLREATDLAQSQKTAGQSP